MGESSALPHAETLDLIVRAQAGDEEAQERLVVCNAPLVRSIVRKFAGRGAEYEDLYQIGCLGLVKAIRNFDTGYNVRFSTYAVPMIAGEIKHFFLAATGNRYAAEPFIGHFLWEYACHFPDRERTFQETTRRVPFYMGATLLRIARNSWLDFSYRRQLVYEAKECLRRWML